jgi:hypothetical protein
MPSTSSDGWLGWTRDDSRPGRPSVLLARTTTSHLAATVIRSRFDISLHTAAAISGVSPGATARSVAPLVAGSSSHSRNWPTVRCATALYAAASRSSSTIRVTSSCSYGTTGLARSSASVRSASTARAATRSTVERAATPARSSPLLGGLARPSSSFTESKR